MNLEETMRTLAQEAKTDPEGVWQRLENVGVLNRLRVHQYLCPAGCKLATVIRIRDVVLMRTRAYRMRPRTNLQRSVHAARVQNTLNGEDYWPGHTFNVGWLLGVKDEPGSLEWAEVVHGDTIRMDINCRHHLRSIAAIEVLRAVEGVTPGKPRKPTILS